MPAVRHKKFSQIPSENDKCVHDEVTILDPHGENALRKKDYTEIFLLRFNSERLYRDIISTTIHPSLLV